MKEIKLSQQGRKNRGLYVALVDDEDFERINQFKWGIIIGKRTFYAAMSVEINGKRTTEYMHSLIMGSKWVDHVDGDGLHCQKLNMRKCTQQQNMMNSRKRENTSSKYKGVTFHKKNNKWVSAIGFNNTQIYLGSFDDEIEAAKAYDKKAVELFGEFANLNIIKEETR